MWLIIARKIIGMEIKVIDMNNEAITSKEAISCVTSKCRSFKSFILNKSWSRGIIETKMDLLVFIFPFITCVFAGIYILLLLISCLHILRIFWITKEGEYDESFGNLAQDKEYPDM